ncbi:MAG: 23S rRNA (uracil(1939)-C(5))-methyltransferase RlmD [Legionellaceae bacterium]|nr:23S rRNA (uracil(1939)-C(5))-methyltransferase RlmD [Legionellaceae bacterium]
MPNPRRKKQAIDRLIHDVCSESLSHDGRGIARLEGKVTFIQGALAHEQVDCTLVNQKKDYNEAIAVRIHQASTDRTTPACAHYAMCGGCSLQHLAPEAQIDFKQHQLLDMLRRIGHCEPAMLLAPIEGPLWNYRHKARLSVRHVKGKNSHLIGFREKNNPRYIADISRCHILRREVGEGLAELRALLNQFDQQDCIAQIELAAGDRDIALIFRNLRDLLPQEAALLRDYAQKTGFRMYLQPAGYDSISLFYPQDGRDFICYALEDYNVEYQFHPADFTQVNPQINRRMVKQAVDLLALQQSDVVMDLFCGLGNFTLPLARFSQSVIGIEGSAMMVERARMNARHNQIENVEFYHQDLFKEEGLSKKQLASANKLLIDPPRSGALEVVKQLAGMNIERIVYVSCNPATLARDAGILVNEQGYRLTQAGVMDMFPHTVHVESMALFEKE